MQDRAHPPPIRIEPGSIYDESYLRLTLGLTEASLRRATQREGLRYARCGFRRFYLGEWVLHWLEQRASERVKEGRR
jgi:hypothetical protein